MMKIKVTFELNSDIITDEATAQEYLKTSLTGPAAGYLLRNAVMQAKQALETKDEQMQHHLRLAHAYEAWANSVEVIQFTVELM